MNDKAFKEIKGYHFFGRNYLVHLCLILNYSK